MFDPTINQIETIPLDREPATYPATQTISDITPPTPQPAPAPKAIGGNDGRQLAERPRFAAPNPETTPQPAPIGKTGSSATMAEIERIRNADKSEFRERSAGKRFVSGLGRAFGSWGRAGAPGGIVGLVSALVTGGLSSSLAPGADSEERRQRQLQKMFGTFGQQIEAEKAQTDLLKSQTDAQGKIIGNERAKLDYLLTQNKPFYDSVMADNMVTPEEAEEARQRGYDISPYDARRFDTEMREGETYEKPQLGKPKWQESELPTERVKVPLGVKITDPNNPESVMEVPMLPGDAANFQYRSGADKAKAEAEAAEIERKRLEKEEEERRKRAEKNFGSVQEWKNAVRKARAQIPVHEKSIQQIDKSIAEVNGKIEQYTGYDTSDLLKTKQALEKQRIDAELKLTDARATAQTPEPKVFTPPASKGKNSRRNRTYTNSEIERIIRQ